jgi:hypothetical protein
LADSSLCLELRQNYVNVYYRGGNLMKVSRVPSGYAAFFDDNYFKGTVPPGSIPEAPIQQPAHVAAWLAALPWLKQGMDLFRGRHPNSERDVQQMILRDNNFGGVARDTDYYVCDIEYASRHGRFDAVAVHWPSIGRERMKQGGRRLVLAEVKYGDGALGGRAGLHAHITDVNEHLADPSNVAALKVEMVHVFNQKRTLGLMDCGRDLLSFSDEPPLLLLILVNHKPAKSRLRKLLRTLPRSTHADLRIATGCLLGYGLYDPAIVTVEEAQARFAACI